MTLCTCMMMFLLSAHSSDSVVGYIMGYKVQCNSTLEDYHDCYYSNLLVHDIIESVDSISRDGPDCPYM